MPTTGSNLASHMGRTRWYQPGYSPLASWILDMVFFSRWCNSSDVLLIHICPLTYTWLLEHLQPLLQVWIWRLKWQFDTNKAIIFFLQSWCQICSRDLEKQLKNTVLGNPKVHICIWHVMLDFEANWLNSNPCRIQLSLRTYDVSFDKWSSTLDVTPPIEDALMPPLA